jgi:hypothetical protein
MVQEAVAGVKGEDRGEGEDVGVGELVEQGESIVKVVTA